MPDIKDLIQDIIADTNNSYPKKGEYNSPQMKANPVSFDKNAYKNKLSMFVLKDVISAMMHDETENLDTMIDASIDNHLKNDCKCSSYDYLVRSRDNLNSPLMSDIIQEIDDTADTVEDEIKETKDASKSENVDIKDILKNVPDYDTFRKKLEEETTKRVVDDVSNEIINSNGAATYDDIDDKFEKKETSEPKTESVILRAAGAIVTESAMAGNRISTEEGLNQAIVEYCIAEMDYLFKHPSVKSIYTKYK